MIHRQSGLGRGLGALIPPRPSVGVASPSATAAELVAAAPASLTDELGAFLYVPLTQISRNPKQPRRYFEHGAMEELVSSVKAHGILEPLIVTRTPDGRYELVAGERRARAAQIAGLEAVPCLVRSATDQQKLELALIENLQREDLNPIEEARAYEQLMEEFGLTQEEVAAKVGKSRPQIANIVRLLGLPDEIQRALIEGKITASNARTLLSLPSDSERLELFQAMLAQSFTVRETAARVPHPRRARSTTVDPNLLEYERRLRDRLGHRVEIKPKRQGQGEIRIGFQSAEDLKGLVDIISE